MKTIHKVKYSEDKKRKPNLTNLQSALDVIAFFNDYGNKYFVGYSADVSTLISTIEDYAEEVLDIDDKRFEVRR